MTTNIITAVITAYCSCKLCCGPNAKGITADGHKALQNYTIAIPRKYRLTTTSVQIGQTLYRGQDRTALRYDGRFDIYMSSHQAARQFGIKTQQVTIITPK